MTNKRVKRTEPLILWLSPEEREIFLHEHAASKIKSRADWLMSLLPDNGSDNTDSGITDDGAEIANISVPVKVYDCRVCPWARHRERDLVYCDVCVRMILDGISGEA